MKMVKKKNSFESQILSQCQNFCKNVQIKNCLKKKTCSYYICLKYDHAKMKIFIVPFLEALTYFQCLVN